MAGNPEVIAWKEQRLKNYMDWNPGMSRLDALNFLGWLASQGRDQALWDVRFDPLDEQLKYAVRGGHFKFDKARGMYYNNGSDGRTFTWKTPDGRDVPEMDGVYPTNFRAPGGPKEKASGTDLRSIFGPGNPEAAAAATPENVLPPFDLSSLLKSASPSSSYLNGLAAWRPDLMWKAD